MFKLSDDLKGDGITKKTSDVLWQHGSKSSFGARKYRNVNKAGGPGEHSSDNTDTCFAFKAQWFSGRRDMPVVVSTRTYCAASKWLSAVPPAVRENQNCYNHPAEDQLSRHNLFLFSFTKRHVIGLNIEKGGGKIAEWNNSWHFCKTGYLWLVKEQEKKTLCLNFSYPSNLLNVTDSWPDMFCHIINVTHFFKW